MLTMTLADFIDVDISPSYIYGAEVVMAIGVGLCNQVRLALSPPSFHYVAGTDSNHFRPDTV